MRPNHVSVPISELISTTIGSLFFGIDNDGIAKGLNDVWHICETISSKIRDYMDPLPEVEMIPRDVDG